MGFAKHGHGVVFRAFNDSTNLLRLRLGKAAAVQYSLPPMFLFQCCELLLLSSITEGRTLIADITDIRSSAVKLSFRFFSMASLNV